MLKGNRVYFMTEILGNWTELYILGILLFKLCRVVMELDTEHHSQETHFPGT